MAEKNQVQVMERVEGLRRVVESPKQIEELRKALPANLDPARIARQCMTLVQYTPKLVDCSPRSILLGLMQAAELGLELNGVLGQAYLVPRWNKDLGGMVATFQVGYRGLIQLAWKSGHLTSFRMQTVKEADDFECEYGTSPYLVHKPAKGKRGPSVGYYATVSFAGQEGAPKGFDFVYLSRDEMEEHRGKYTDKKSFAWATDIDAMAEKSCARKLGKRLPVAVELSAACALDEQNEAQVGPTFDQLAAEQEPLMEGPDVNQKFLEAMHGGEAPAPEQDPQNN
jgi:recombination protein RecT